MDKEIVFPFVVVSQSFKSSKSLQVIMPESPIRSRARRAFFTDDEANMVAHLRRHAATIDMTVDDPNTAAAEAPHDIGGTSYPITLVTAATPKYHWTDISCSSRVDLERFLGHYHTATLANDFVAEADMNPVLRRTREVAFYKNKALKAHVVALAQAYNPVVDVEALITRGLICAVEVY